MTPFALLFICVSLTLAKDGGHHGGHKVGPDFGGHILDHGGHHGGHGGGHHGGHIGGHDGFHHGGHHGGGHTAVHVEGGHHGHHGHHHYDDHYEPPHYSYGYNVYGGTPYEARFDKLELENNDDNPNLRFDKSETRSEGLTTGGYSVDLPDGRTQVPFRKSMSAPTGALSLANKGLTKITTHVAPHLRLLVLLLPFFQSRLPICHLLFEPLAYFHLEYGSLPGGDLHRGGPSWLPG